MKSLLFTNVNKKLRVQRFAGRTALSGLGRSFTLFFLVQEATRATGPSDNNNKTTIATTTHIRITGGKKDPVNESRASRESGRDTNI